MYYKEWDQEVDSGIDNGKVELMTEECDCIAIVG